MNVAVVGSRNFKDYELMKSELDKIDIAFIISGGAFGADSLAARYSIDVLGVEPIEIKPNWKKYALLFILNF